MTRTTKYCNSLRAAEKHQEKLYDKYHCVVLESFPVLSDEGRYTWVISKPI